MPPPGLLEKVLTLNARNKFVGPFPADTFLDTFLPMSSCSIPDINEASFSQIPRKRTSHMFKPLITAVRPFCSMLRLCRTTGSSGEKWRVYQQDVKPQVAMYDTSVPQDVDTDISRMEAWMEVTAHEEEDPFDDPPPQLTGEDLFAHLRTHPFERETEQGMRTRGRTLAHAIAQLGSQNRNFAFSTILFGRFARLVRWDRAGAAVSRRFDYTKTPELLAKFFWRLSQASRDSRGSDESVSPADLDNEVAATIRQQLDMPPDEQLFRYEIHDDADPIPSTSSGGADEHGRKPSTTSRCYYGPRFDFMPWDLTGSSTRTAVLWDLTTGKKVFLKDLWRPDSTSAEKEGDIYRTLQSHNVPHIAPMERSGDVPSIHGARTQTQDYSEQYLGILISGYVHYRLTLGVVGKRLSQFSSPSQLVSALADALEAHKGAYESAKILHRDISAGNIILSPTGEGLLIDWDHCLNMDSPSYEEAQYGISGTWEFISGRLLMEPDNEIHTLQDDLESFLHVATWTSVGGIHGKLSSEEREYYLDQIFRDKQNINGREVGGTWKHLRLINENCWGPDNWLPDHSHLLLMLRKLGSTFGLRYRKPPSDEERRKYRVAGEELRATLPELYETLYVCVYDKAMAAIQTHDWMIEVLREGSKAMEELDDQVLTTATNSDSGSALIAYPIKSDSRENERVHRKRLEQSPSLPAEDQRLRKKVKQA
ncbi:hypothetical protein CONPUDRAFT_167363 [Coniophora puteana RWD-64-598 SS2]|uniref:Fungal-type protein kinase domain-containing protein n=1 Tax=Coniophora puteana (strain RWD-64-598) TaxID=741705 RepID=A0A5M3MHS0_CONPW|nr:uncharacterized protein CONPUDRAFT_167363 [Coniophora puteana RWD-64-598 SS2]EIW78334.1 hypothetical protein CONPUDRAFT_167363 [Coniophora puteana RWD-64-598 SS2]